MTKKYFSKHYSLLNKIDFSDEESIKNFYLNSIRYYEKELFPFLPKDKGIRILDVGCGIGAALNSLAINGYNNFYGIDSSIEQVEICKKYITDKVLKIDLFDFFVTNSELFDVIILFDIIEHIEKDKIIPMIEMIFNKLNPAGCVIVRTPNMGSFLANYSRYIDFTHTIGFTPESLRQVFSEFDFREVNLFNSYIGKKRKIILKILLKIFELAYNIKISEIITQNLILVATK